MIVKLATVLCVAASVMGQPDAEERRDMLEQRRVLLAAQLEAIDAELAGDVPPGSARLFGQRGERGERAPQLMRDRGPEPGRVFDEETRERLLDELAQNDPELAERIRETMRARRGAAGPVFGRLHEINELRERDPEAFALRRNEIRAGLEVVRLSGALRDLFAQQAEQAAIDEATGRLREAVAQGFDTKGAVLKNEIERTEARLTDMRTKISHAEANRESIIEQQLDRLLGRIRRSDSQPDRSSESRDD